MYTDQPAFVAPLIPDPIAVDLDSASTIGSGISCPYSEAVPIGIATQQLTLTSTGREHN